MTGSVHDFNSFSWKFWTTQCLYYFCALARYSNYLHKTFPMKCDIYCLKKQQIIPKWSKKILNRGFWYLSLQKTFDGENIKKVKLFNKKKTGFCFFDQYVLNVAKQLQLLTVIFCYTSKARTKWKRIKNLLMFRFAKAIKSFWPKRLSLCESCIEGCTRKSWGKFWLLKAL